MNGTRTGIGLEAAIFAGRHLLVVPLVVALAYVPGRRAFRAIRFDSLAEELAFCSGIGLGILGTAVFILGLFGGIRPILLVGLAVAALASGGSTWRALRTRILAALAKPEGRRRFWKIATVACVLALPWAMMALYPSTWFDATMYHLPVARAYANAHRIVPLPFLRFSVFPQLVEMLTAATLSLSDEISAQEVEVVVFLLAGTASAALAMRAFPKTVGWLAFCLWLASPMAAAAGVNVQVETALALFGTLALLGGIHARDTGDARWAIASGACAGFAAGTKYLGLYFVAFVCAMLVIDGRRRHSWKNAALFVLAAAATGGPWYVRTAAATGNPVFPFLGRIFGEGAWTKVDRIAIDAAHFAHASNTPDVLLRAARTTFFDDRILRIGPSIGLLGYVFLPGAILLASRRETSKIVALAVGAAVIPWIFTARDPHYLLAILPSAIALAGQEIVLLLKWGARWLGWAGEKMMAVIAAAVVAAPALVGPFVDIADLGPPPRSTWERDGFLQARLPAYACYRYLNSLGSRYTVFGLFDERMTYYATGTRIGDYFGPARYSGIRLGTGRELYESLIPFHADYVMFSTGIVRPPVDPTFFGNFALVCEAPGAKLYKVRGQ